MNATLIELSARNADEHIFWLFKSWKSAYKCIAKLTKYNLLYPKYNIIGFRRRQPITQQQFIFIPT